MAIAAVLVTIAVSFIIFIFCVRTYCILSQKNYTRKESLVGKVALVTGGSSGIGYQIVLGLVSRGCKVIIADLVVDESIKQEIYKHARNPNVSLKYLDLSSFSSVRAFAEDIKKSEDKLDILINNAGVGQGHSLRTEDGISITMQVNYYSAFLLTHLLLDLLRKSSSGARIIFTTSLLAFLHPLTTSSVKKHAIETGYEFFSYSISKFCQILASDTFAKKLKKYRITSNSFHPFAAYTNIFKNSYKGAKWYEYWGLSLIEIIAFLIGKTPEEAAQTGIYLACADEVKDVTGGLFQNLTLMTKPRKAADEEFGLAIWEESERVVKLRPEERLT